jgi:hypothetical protein
MRTVRPSRNQPRSSTSILVTAVVADGPYAKMWGLQRNDAITEIGPLTVPQVVTDSGSADDYVMDAYQHGEPLTVYRNGQKVVLQAQSALQPNPGPASPNHSGNPLQNQLDAIQSQQIPTH